MKTLIVRDENINWSWFYEVIINHKTAYVSDSWRIHKRNPDKYPPNYLDGLVLGDEIIIGDNTFRRIDND